VARAFAHEQQGRLAIRSANLADYMDAAMPLSLALARSNLAVASEVRMATDVGEKTGTLSQSLTKVLQQTNDAEQLAGTFLAKTVYVSWIFGVMFLILTFMMLKIVPTFEHMFAEFDLQLPAVTVALINCSRAFAEFWYIPALAVAILWAVTALLMFTFIGIPIRNLPVVEWFYSATDRAAVLQQLAVSVREKQSFLGTLELLSAYSRSLRSRKRLYKAVREIADGRPWHLALQKARILTQAQGAVLYSAEQAGNLAWALEEMAESTLRRSANRIQACVGFMFPITILGCGLCVAFVALGMLLPLFSLIGALA
jgi:type II secretory pathway component PulF